MMYVVCISVQIHTYTHICIPSENNLVFNRTTVDNVFSVIFICLFKHELPYDAFTHSIISFIIHSGIH